MSFEGLPGGDLVEAGLRDLAAGAETVEAFLVSMAVRRLRDAGIQVPEPVLTNPERRLYDLLAQEDPDSAHSRYNALVGRLVSFENAVECVGL